MNSASIKVYNSVDLFKFLMSVAVVAIHTNPIVYCTNEFVIRVTVMIEDWAVPFFFVASGFFLWNSHEKHIDQYIKKIIRLYCVWTLVSLPLAIYGYAISENTWIGCILSYIKYFFFVGKLYNSYHLWYLLALIYALFVIRIMKKKNVNIWIILSFSAVVYFIAQILQFGMNHLEDIPYFMSKIVQVYQYVFNKGGVFTGFLFVSIGMLLAEYHPKINIWILLTGTMGLGILSMFSSEFMKQWIIIPEILVLFLFILSLKLPDSNVWFVCRKMSTIIYLSHLIIYSIYTFIVIKNPNKLGLDSFLFTMVICIAFALWVIYSQKGKAFKRILF